MNAVLLHIRFPHAGPWSGAMAEAFGALADDIGNEPGLHWKLWLEDQAGGSAGGAYLFADRASAERYLDKHRARLAQWGITALDVAVAEVQADLSRRSRAGQDVLPVPQPAPFTTWAEVAVEDFERFLHVFSTAGLAARRRHGSLAAQVFRVPDDAQAARVLIDWRDRDSFEAFIADPQVKATMRSGGALRPPVFTIVERSARFAG